MDAYQFFKITGVAYKIFFPAGTTPGATPVQWSLGYSASSVLNPSLAFGPLQTLANYQTSGCSSMRPVKRYFKIGSTLKRLGIEWSAAADYFEFDSNPPIPLYGGQLPVNAGSSSILRVYRSGDATDESAELGRLQLTYYIQYKGAKGLSTLT